MKYEFKRYVWAVSLVLALPLLALAAFVTSSSGDNGKFDWFTVGTKLGTVIEHTIAYGINDDGVAVGTSELNTGAEHGFVTKDDGEHISAIDVPNACATEATAINDEGVIGGIYEKGTACVDTLFLKKGNNFNTITLPTTAAFKSTRAVCTGTFNALTGKCTVTVNSPDLRGISDEEDVVGGFGGDYGFVIADGKFRVLEVCTETAISGLREGCAPGTTDAWGINDEYVVVGHYEDNVVNGFCELDDGVLECGGFHHGFIWTKKGEEGSFKKLYCDGDRFSNTDANAISEEGVIAGRCNSNAFVLFPPYRDSDWHQFSIPEPGAGQFRCPSGMELNKTIAWGISEDKIAGSYTCEKPLGGVNEEKSYSFTVKIKDVL